jgi:hypothetical protein
MALKLIILFFALHCLCDYPWQGQFLSDCKARITNPAHCLWWLGLTAHAMIQAGGVMGVLMACGYGDWTGIAIAEFAAHWAIDWHKGLGRHRLISDQIAHLSCKLLWVWIVLR